MRFGLTSTAAFRTDLFIPKQTPLPALNLHTVLLLTTLGKTTESVHCTITANSEFRVPYLQRYLFNAIPDTNRRTEEEP